MKTTQIPSGCPCAPSLEPAGDRISGRHHSQCSRGRRLRSLLCALLLPPALAAPAAAQTLPSGRIAYVRYGDQTLWVFDTSTRSPTPVPLDPGMVQTVYTACWTPDGQWIVFAGDYAGQSQVYAVRPDGSDLRRISDGTGHLVDVAVSADGGRIACQQVYGNVFAFNFDGTGKTDLGYGIDMVSWSPSGDRLVGADWALGGGYTSDLYIWNLNTGAKSKITSRPEQTYYNLPRWAPNGAKIAAVFGRHTERGDTDIVIMNVDGSEIVNLTEDWTSDDHGPAWTPDNQFLLFTSTHDASTDIWVMRPDGSGRTKLISGNGAVLASPSMVLRPSIEDGLVAHYRLDADGADASGNGHHGTPHGTIAFQPGVFGMAAAFDGNGYFVVPNAPGLKLENVSMSAWIQLPADYSAYNGYDAAHVISKGAVYGARACDYGMRLGSRTESNDKRIVFEYSGGASEYLLDGPVLTLPAWHHVVEVFQDGATRIYVDGTLTASGSNPFSTLRVSDEPLYIGARYNQPFIAGGFKGLIDEVRLYNRALTAEDAAALYMIGTNGSCGGLVYSEDFSTAPGWTSNDAAKLGWDPSTGTFHGVQVNTEGTYAYIDLPTFNANKAWCLEWDQRINANDWSAGIDIGLMDQRTLYPYHAGLSMGEADGGNYTGPWGSNSIYTPAWQSGVWYHCVLRYDPVTHQLVSRVTNRETGDELLSNGQTVMSFPAETTRLGVTRLHTKNTGSGASGQATVDYNLDNIRLYGEAAPILLAPMPLARVLPAGSVELSPRICGTQPLSFEWSFNGATLPATGPTLAISSATAANGGTYCVVVSNAYGSVTNCTQVSVLDLDMFAGVILGGPIGTKYRIEYITAIGESWKTLTTLTLNESPKVWIDMESANQPKRFYRAVVEE